MLALCLLHTSVAAVFVVPIAEGPFEDLLAVWALHSPAYFAVSG